jgi:hypothetical protein
MSTLQTQRTQKKKKIIKDGTGLICQKNQIKQKQRDKVLFFLPFTLIFPLPSQLLGTRVRGKVKMCQILTIFLHRTHCLCEFCALLERHCVCSARGVSLHHIISCMTAGTLIFIKTYASYIVRIKPNRRPTIFCEKGEMSASKS